MYEDPIDEEPPPPAEPHPIAKAVDEVRVAIGLPRQREEDDWVTVPCRVCGAETTVLKAIYDAVKLFNQNENKRGLEAENGGLFHRPEYISKSQIVACEGECTIKERNRIAHEAAVDRATTDHHLETIKTGHLSPEGASWLRRHGFAQNVQDYYTSPAATGAAT